MATAGIIGGIGPESTIEYYRSMFAAYRERVHDGSAPAIVITSIDLDRMLGMVAARQLDQLTAYLLEHLEKLAAAGADFGLLAAATPHIVFDDLRRRSPIPLLSLVEATCDAAGALGLKRPGIFGTRFTIAAGFFEDVFAPRGITIVHPAPADQEYIHEKYMSELVRGILLPATREGLLAIVDRLVASEGIDGLILGGTELPPIFRDTPAPVPFLDTTAIHVRAAVDRLLAG